MEDAETNLLMFVKMALPEDVTERVIPFLTKQQTHKNPRRRLAGWRSFLEVVMRHCQQDPATHMLLAKPLNVFADAKPEFRAFAVCAGVYDVEGEQMALAASTQTYLDAMNYGGIDDA